MKFKIKVFFVIIYATGTIHLNLAVVNNVHYYYLPQYEKQKFLQTWLKVMDYFSLQSSNFFYYITKNDARKTVIFFKNETIYEKVKGKKYYS